MNTLSTEGTPDTHASGTAKRPSLVRMVGLSVLGLGIICLALWGIVLINSGSFLAGAPNLTLTARAEKDLSCKQLVEQAMQQSNTFCSDIGTNQLCYGNFSIDADLAQGTNVNFSERGDVIDVDILRRLSAAPLDLVTQAWGIAVFKVTANLPRSLPGQTVTVLVFGNTTLNKDEPGLQTFYFFSDTGQVICDEVPFDGLFITMPDGVGAQFTINGAELVLTGTASITANLGGEMNISLFSGSAQVTSDGQTQIFGPGEQVSIPLGGENGMESVGPPSEPIPLSDEELALICSLTGEHCQKDPIPTIAMTDLAATVESEFDPTSAPGETLPASTSTPQNTATALASPTSFPTTTLVPPPPPTPRPTWTSTRKPNPTATFTPAHTFTPAQTATFTRTFTPTLTQTSTNTSTNTPTNTPTNTTTNTPTNTPTHTPTNTATNTPTNTPTPVPACDIVLGSLTFSGSQLSMNITNNVGATITLDTLNVAWVDIPSQQRLSTVHLNAIQLFSGNTMNTPPSSFTFSPPINEISNGSTATLILGFDEPLNTATTNSYTIQTIFNICTLSQSGPLP